MSADTSGTSIIASSFDREERQLTLYGPATPDVFESILQTITYTNLAPDINVAVIEVDVHDGINNTIATITVIQGMMRRKRDAPAINKPLLQQQGPDGVHVITARDVKMTTEKREDKESTLRQPFLVIAFSSVGILLAMIVAFKTVHYKYYQPESVV